MGNLFDICLDIFISFAATVTYGAVILTFLAVL